MYMYVDEIGKQAFNFWFSLLFWRMYSHNLPKYFTGLWPPFVSSRDSCYRRNNSRQEILQC